MVDYTNLKPGLYVQRGNNIKGLDNLAAFLGGEGAYTPSDVRTLAAKVAWVYIALSVRGEFINQIPYSWRRDDDEVEVAPYLLSMREVIPQIDEALQVYSRAYLLKARARRGIQYIRWLDPASMEPDPDSVEPPFGYRRYLRTLDNGQRVAISADDLIVFRNAGLGELEPRPSATSASTLAAQVLYGIGMTADTYFDNNGLPVMLVMVSPSTQAPEVERIESRFARIFNRNKGTKEFRTIGVKNDVKVEKLSLAPSDLAMDTLSEAQIKQVLGAHRVPMTVAMSDATNRSVAEVDLRSIVTTMGARFEYIADVFNRDPDIMRDGYSLHVQPDDHWSMKRDEAEAALAVTRWATILHPEAAAFIMGITKEDFPDDLQERIFLDEARRGGQFGNSDQGESDLDVDDPADDTGKTLSLLAADLDKYRRKALKSFEKGNGAAVLFQSEHIDADSAALLNELLEAAKSAEDIEEVFNVAV